MGKRLQIWHPVINISSAQGYFVRLIVPRGTNKEKTRKSSSICRILFSCQSSSLPTLVSDWLTHSWFITQSDRPLPDFPHETSQLLRTNKQPFQDFHNRSSWLPRSLGSWWSRWTGQDRQNWHLNLIFQVTCVTSCDWQLSQFLRCLKYYFQCNQRINHHYWLHPKIHKVQIWKFFKYFLNNPALHSMSVVGLSYIFIFSWLAMYYFAICTFFHMITCSWIPYTIEHITIGENPAKWKG